MKPRSTAAPKEPPHAATSAAALPALAASTAILDAGLKQQLEVFNRFSCAILNGSQGLRKMQLDAAHEALMRHQHCRDRLRACENVNDALEATRDAGSADLEAASRYWTDFSRICNETLAEITELQGNSLGVVRGLGARQPGAETGVLPFVMRNPWADWITFKAPLP